MTAPPESRDPPVGGDARLPRPPSGEDGQTIVERLRRFDSGICASDCEDAAWMLESQAATIAQLREENDCTARNALSLRERDKATIATLQRQLDMAKNPTEATPAPLDRSAKSDRE